MNKQFGLQTALLCSVAHPSSLWPDMVLPFAKPRSSQDTRVYILHSILSMSLFANKLHIVFSGLIMKTWNRPWSRISTLESRPKVATLNHSILSLLSTQPSPILSPLHYKLGTYNYISCHVSITQSSKWEKNISCMVLQCTGRPFCWKLKIVTVIAKRRHFMVLVHGTVQKLILCMKSPM